MIKINISTEVSNISELSDMLRNIANQIDNGNTSGYYPTWNINDETERLQKIEYIKRVLGDYGMVTTGELSLDCSPMYNSMGNDCVSLIEAFTDNYVRVVEYVHETETNEFEVTYEELSDDIIDVIYPIIHEYETEIKQA